MHVDDERRPHRDGARGDAFDDGIDRGPVTLRAGRHAVDLPLYGPQTVLLGDDDVTRLAALDLGIAAPVDLCRAGEELRLGLGVDRGTRDLLFVGEQRRGQALDRRTLLDLGGLLGRWRRIELRLRILTRGLGDGGGRE